MAVRDDGSLADGVWLLRNGDGFYLDESRAQQPEQLPGLGAGKVLRHLFSQAAAGELPTDLFNIERMREWLGRSQSPTSAELEAWNHRMMATAILCGLTLVWRGGITTTLQGLEEVSQLVQASAQQFVRLAWPPESLLAVTTVGEEGEPESEHMSLGFLTGEWADEAVDETPANQSVPASQPATAADALKVIKLLLEEGLITEAEFTQKRQEILARI